MSNTAHAPLTPKDRGDLKKAFTAALIAIGPNLSDYSMDFNGATIDLVLRVVMDLEAAEKAYESLMTRCMAIGSEKELLVDILQEVVNVLDGRTEPVHPVSWLAVLEKAKQTLAEVSP